MRNPDLPPVNELAARTLSALRLGHLAIIGPLLGTRPSGSAHRAPETYRNPHAFTYYKTPMSAAFSTTNRRYWERVLTPQLHTYLVGAMWDDEDSLILSTEAASHSVLSEATGHDGQEYAVRVQVTWDNRYGPTGEPTPYQSIELRYKDAQRETANRIGTLLAAHCADPATIIYLYGAKDDGGEAREFRGTVEEYLGFQQIS